MITLSNITAGKRARAVAALGLAAGACLGLMDTSHAGGWPSSPITAMLGAGAAQSGAMSAELKKANTELAKCDRELQEAEKRLQQARKQFQEASAADKAAAAKKLVKRSRQRNVKAEARMRAQTKVTQLEKQAARPPRKVVVKQAPEPVKPVPTSPPAPKVAAEIPKKATKRKVASPVPPKPAVKPPVEPAPKPARKSSAKPAVEPVKKSTAKAPAEKTAAPAPKPALPPVRRGISFERSGTPTHHIRAVVILGNRDEVYEIRGWDRLEKEIVGTSLSEADITALQNKILQELRQDGYVFAKVDFDRPALGVGFLAFAVQVGEIGDVKIVGNRHYRAKQIIENVDAKRGASFNYRDLYQNLFALNVKPDVTVDTKLKPRDEADGTRVIDMEVAVRDKLPIHAAFNLANTGRKETNDWQVRTTLQHLNLTKHDDVLSLQWLTDPQNVDDVNALSISYFAPITEDWDLTLYGGISRSDINGLFEDFDVYGEGEFGGFRLSRVLVEDSTRSLDLALGYTFQRVANNTDFGDAPSLGILGETYSKKKARLGMPYINLGYASKRFDSYGGRNFLSGTVTFNWEDQLGSYGEDDFHRNYKDSDGTFVITKLQAARFQKLYSGVETPGKWTFMGRVTAQLTGDSLVPAVKAYMGGVNTVRGYEEDEYNGDESIVVNLELRTPLMSNFIPGLKADEAFLRKNPEAWQQHRLQFLAFADYGYIKRESPLVGENEDDSMYSAGLGLRMNLTKYFQLKVDYGFPLEETVDSDGHGRGHIALQLQY